MSSSDSDDVVVTHDRAVFEKRFDIQDYLPFMPENLASASSTGPASKQDKGGASTKLARVELKSSSESPKPEERIKEKKTNKPKKRSSKDQEPETDSKKKKQKKNKKEQVDFDDLLKDLGGGDDDDDHVDDGSPPPSEPKQSNAKGCRGRPAGRGRGGGRKPKQPRHEGKKKEACSLDMALEVTSEMAETAERKALEAKYVDLTFSQEA